MKTMFNKNEIKKELLRSKTMANFSHYSNGKLYYITRLESGLYLFPISTVDSVSNTDGHEYIINNRPAYNLSSDLGETNFDAEIKASFLNRWIDKAIDSEDFIKIG